ncbi:MAG: alpha-amylase, partial [Acholeplasmataceae bacterium]|nr:alpha-amylase [Acholeplasmataceae bacterium]
MLLFSCKEEIDPLVIANPRNGVIYQIFVRSFADSDQDGIGDLKGITEKLDYLEDLGVEALWLMPIFPSPSYHGYDITDYYAINPEYGSLEDFQELLRETKKRGMKIILDMVFNHTSENHPWFLDALAGDEKYRNYYSFKSSNPGTLGSWGQGIWHGNSGKYYCGYFSPSMPDLNLFNEQVIEEIKNISCYWVEMGVDGFRLDAAQHFFGTNEYPDKNYDYYENIIFIQELRNVCLKINPQFYLLGEINIDIPSVIGEYYKSLHSPLDFPVATRIMTSARSNSGSGYVNNLLRIYEKYLNYDRQFLSAPFLANHDQDRVADQLQGDLKKMKLAAEMLLTLPGSPIIYYGEEIGMYGVKANGKKSNNTEIWDETRRLPFCHGDDFDTYWFVDGNFESVEKNQTVISATQQLNDCDSLLTHYQRIIRIRNSTPALKYGNSLIAYEDNNNHLQGFYREYSYRDFYQKVLVIHNFSTEDQEMIPYQGRIIYASGEENPSTVTSIKAKS